MAVASLEATVVRGERLNTTEAIVRLCMHLLDFETFTTAEAAELIGYSHEGARLMLGRISRYLQIYQDEKGRWQLLERRRAPARSPGPGAHDDATRVSSSPRPRTGA
jgi:hypothetical protein